ncbi:MAG: Peptidyl-prolyl cis-trans isomerase D [Gammaproteobacteria bacterium]|nr:MAG: Peptidyl-prolyl cis-trans isomerase D [Gammaproteobacteria bacterium]
MSSWVVGVLLFLVAIPLIFMGLGNYQTASQSYAFKINDQIVTTAQLEQEVYQYRQALEKNFQGNLPPIYTNKFIKSITMDYMLRTILLDQASRNNGLVFHNDSIIKQIYSTSSFKDENGFNKDLYKSQLFKIGMNPKAYEGYIFQKGITQQIKNAITETVVLTEVEKQELIKFKNHIRDISYTIINYNDIKKSIKLTDQDLNNHYIDNKENYKSAAFARFKYIDIDKNDLIKNIKINDELVNTLYEKYREDGLYSKPISYKVNHILITKNAENYESMAEEALTSIKNGLSFSKAANIYSDDEQTINSGGYLGEFILADLPEYISAAIITMDVGQISELIESDQGYHIISVLEKSENSVTPLDDVKKTIINDYKKENGTRMYFDLIDQISEKNFSKKYTITDLSEIFNVELKSSKYISEQSGHGIFNYDFLRKSLFNNSLTENNETSDLLYINDDRFIIAELDDYKKPLQLTFDESKSMIKALLLTQTTESKMISISEETRDNLNAGLSKEEQNLLFFTGNVDSKNINLDMKNIFFASSSKIGYSIKELDNGDYIIFTIKSISYPENLDKIDGVNDYINFATNTRSESEYNLFYNLIKSSSEIVINDEYMSRD